MRPNGQWYYGLSLGLTGNLRRQPAGQGQYPKRSGQASCTLDILPVHSQHGEGGGSSGQDDIHALPPRHQSAENLTGESAASRKDIRMVEAGLHSRRRARRPHRALPQLPRPCHRLLAVVPEHRGHGYACDLLAEATHLLVSEGADRIVADTDVTNTPMAATFAKARYPVIEHRIDFTY